MHRQSPGMTREQRFWSKVDVSAGLFGCWPWMGTRERDGYGVISNGYGVPKLRAHRISLELHLGRPLGPGMFALHRCDNPPCCNPAHLFEGTQADNVADMVAKGRARPGGLSSGGSVGRSRGRSGGQARALLTPELVVALRAASSTHSVRQLAVLFGISKSQAHRVATGQRWTRIPMEAFRV